MKGSSRLASLVRIFVFLIGCQFFSNSILAQHADIIIGVVGGRHSLENSDPFRSFSDYLDRTIPEYRFEVVVFNNVADLISAVAAGRLQFAMVDPIVHAELALDHNVRTIATATQPVGNQAYPWLAGAVFSLDSRDDINTLADAKGHGVIALSEESLGGWLSAVREWRSLDLDEASDFNRLNFAYSNQQVIDGVCSGTFEIGVVAAGIFNNLRSTCDRPLKVLRNPNLQLDPRFPLEVSTSLYPEAAFAVLNWEVEESLILAVTQALLRLKSGSEEARDVAVAGFTAPLSYAPVIDLMLDLRLGPYVNAGRLTFAEFIRLHGAKAIIVFLGVLVLILARSRYLNNRPKQADRFRQSLFENSNLPAVILDAKTLTFIDLNQSAVEIYGFKNSADLIGQTPERVSAPIQKNGKKSKMEISTLYERLQSGERLQFEWLHQRPDGSQWEAEIYIVSFELSNVLMLQATLVDVTERNRIRDERTSMEQQLRQAQRLESLGRLSGAIAHDFNNILSVINGYSELLLMKLSKDHEAYHTIGDIAKAGWRARELTSQLLTFGRRQITRTQPVDINALITESANMYRTLLGENIELQIALQPNLQRTLADSGQLNQVFMNILVNAKDAMPDGGKCSITTNKALVAKTETKLLNLEEGAYLMLTISDTGHGMTDDVKEHIFEPFFSTKGEKGNGIGLATVYGIIRQCGGTITFFSELNVGTTFCIYLPVTEVKGDGKSQVEKLVENLNAPKHIKVLVVEDQQDVRLYASSVLRTAGYEVLEAESGEQALTIAEQHNGDIEVLFTDVVMAGMNGRELSEQFEKRWPHSKILFTSGYADDEIALHGVTQDKIQFVPKPYMPQHLLSKLKEMLELSTVNL